jgi:hypothetical protein
MAANRERTTRRGVLASAGAAVLVGVAGCVGGDDSDTENANDSESAESNGQANSENGEGSTGEEASVTVLVEMVGGGTGTHEGHDHGEGHDEENDGEGSHDNHEKKESHSEEGHGHEEGAGHSEENHDGHEKEEGHSEGSHDSHDEGGPEGKLSESTISHTCGHFEEIDDFGVAKTVEGPADPGDAMEITSTHTTYEVTFEGDSTYVKFHAEGAGHDGEESHSDGGHEGHDHGESGHEGEENHSDEGHDHGGAGGEMVSFFTKGGSPSVETGTEVYHESDEQQCGPMDQYVVVEPEDGETVVELSPDS